MAATTTATLKLDVGTKARLNKLGAARRRTPHWLMKDAGRRNASRGGRIRWQRGASTGKLVVGCASMLPAVRPHSRACITETCPR